MAPLSTSWVSFHQQRLLHFPFSNSGLAECHPSYPSNGISFGVLTNWEVQSSWGSEHSIKNTPHADFSRRCDRQPYLLYVKPRPGVNIPFPFNSSVFFPHGLQDTGAQQTSIFCSFSKLQYFIFLVVPSLSICSHLHFEVFILSHQSNNGVWGAGQLHCGNLFGFWNTPPDNPEKSVTTGDPNLSDYLSSNRCWGHILRLLFLLLSFG